MFLLISLKRVSNACCHLKVDAEATEELDVRVERLEQETPQMVFLEVVGKPSKTESVLNNILCFRDSPKT
jgi:hypothetical protein